MAIVHTTMTDEQRKSVAVEYFKSFDRGYTSDGRPFIELFAEDAVVYFPKWGIARGRKEIIKMFGDLASNFKWIIHHEYDFNTILTGTDTLVIEGRTSGEHRDGPWEADHPAWGAGRWCDVFEIRDFLIQRVFIYLDPDYAGKDIARYQWIKV